MSEIVQYRTIDVDHEEGIVMMTEETPSDTAEAIAEVEAQFNKGIITAQYLKDATDPQWANDADFKEWKAWMAQYIRIGNLADSGCVYAYTVSSTLHDCLKRCGDDLARFSGETWELFGGVPSNESTWATLPAEFRSVTLAPGSTGDALPVEQTFASDKTRQGTALAQIPDPGCSFSQGA